MQFRASVLGILAALASLASTAHGAVIFTFDTMPQYQSLPLRMTVGGITTSISATFPGYSVQAADVAGFTPSGFSGNILYPTPSTKAELLLFDFPGYVMTDFSILVAIQDPTAVIRATATTNGAVVATSTTQGGPGNWATSTLSLQVPSGYDRVMLTFDAASSPAQASPMYMVDNLLVTGALAPDPPVPEPATLGTAALGAALLLMRRRHARPPLRWPDRGDTGDGTRRPPAVCYYVPMHLLPMCRN